MRKNPKSLIKIMTIVFALSFLFFIFSETIAHARAGGGRSSGSRGFSSGRTYQRSTPSSPTRTPQAPQQTQPGQTIPPQVQQPSFGRSLLYGIGGGLIGGMIGSMLFGRPGYAGPGWGGGFGFADLIILLLIVGIIYYVVKRIRAKRLAEESAVAGYSAYSYNTPAQATSQEPTYDGYMEQENPVLAGIRHISQTDPSFNEAKFKDIAQDIFFKIQGAWTRRDLTGVKDLLTPQMYNIFQDEINKMMANKQINRLENIAVREVEIVDAAQDHGEEYITVKFYANLLDYTVDETTGKVISGSDSDPVKFIEYWTFYRKTGDAQWKLSGITQENDY